jgi:tetratricopeptide (TPR) repeat protein
MKAHIESNSRSGPPTCCQPWKLLLLLAVIFLAYTSAINCGYIWDDDMYVTDNATLASAGGLARIWATPQASPQYYPLVFTSFWLEHRLWGTDPLGYHLVNVLLHACLACLLYYLLLRLEVPGAWLAALVFAVHPVHVETVAWISERKNVLSGLFYMLSAIALLRFYRIGRPTPFFLPRTAGASERPSTSSQPKEVRNSLSSPIGVFPLRGFSPSRENLLNYCAGLLFFAFALLSKTVTCSLPAALILVLWWNRGRITAREALSLAPFFALGAGMGLLTAWLERTHVGAGGADWGLSIAGRFLVACRALCFYVSKLLWPVGLSFNYERWIVDAAAWWQYIYPLAVAAALLLLWVARGRFGRGPLAAALFFIVSLFPALGFFDVFPFRYSYVADHFQYLASIGPITLVVGAAAALVSPHYRKRPRLVTAASILPIAFLAAMTWHQGHKYADARTLWEETLKNNPRSFLAHNNIGSLLSKQGKRQEAMEHFAEALAVNPDFEKAHYNMAVELAALGKTKEAVEHYEAAHRLDPRDPSALNNLGSLLAQSGRIEDAVRCWSGVVAIRPDYTGAHYNLLMAYRQLGDQLAAQKEYGRIRDLDPALAAKIANSEK